MKPSGWDSFFWDYYASTEDSSEDELLEFMKLKTKLLKKKLDFYGFF